MQNSVEAELEERTPFDPIFEVLKNNEAAKILLKPVPQLDAPLGATSSSHWQTGIKEVLGIVDKNLVPPVSFCAKRAFVESQRLSHTFVTKGQILSCRTPDLVIRYSLAMTSNQWEKTEEKKD